MGSRVDTIDIINELGGVACNLASYVADMKADLVIVGSAGRTGLASVFGGSTAIEILERMGHLANGQQLPSQSTRSLLLYCPDCSRLCAPPLMARPFPTCIISKSQIISDSAELKSWA